MTSTSIDKRQILIIYPQLDEPYSGGQVIDFSFIEQLANSGKFTCNYLLDADVSNTSIRGYIFYTLCNLRRIARNDIIFTNSRLYTTLFPCFLLLRLFYRDIKIIAYHHHFNYYTQIGILKCIHRFFELNFLKMMSTVIIPSPYVRDEMRKILPKTDIEYIEIGFNLSTSPETNKSKTNNLLYVGTVEERKGVHYLIYLARFLKERKIDYHIHIVGSLAVGKYVQSIEKMIDDNGLRENITLVGRVNEEKLNVLYKDSSVFVFPSSHEGYGMVLIEAFSHGLPIVAFNNSAMPYSVKNNFNGLLAPDGDVEDFCRKVEQLITDEYVWRKLSDNAYQSALKVPTLRQMEYEMKQFIDRL